VAVLRKAGVSDQVLAPVLKSMKIKMPPAAVGKPDNVAKTEPGVSSNTAGNADTLDYKSLQAAVAQLRTRDAKSLVAHIDKIDGVTQVAEPSAPNVAALAKQMANASDDDLEIYASQGKAPGTKDAAVAEKERRREIARAKPSKIKIAGQKSAGGAATSAVPKPVVAV
jgi:hypothetical protein